MKNRHNHSGWRIVIALQFIWAAILAGGMAFLPESPRYLIRKGRDEDAARALARLLSIKANHSLISFELNDIRANLRQEMERSAGGYRELFVKENQVRSFMFLWGCHFCTYLLFYEYRCSSVSSLGCSFKHGNSSLVSSKYSLYLLSIHVPIMLTVCFPTL